MARRSGGRNVDGSAAVSLGLDFDAGCGGCADAKEPLVGTGCGLVPFSGPVVVPLETRQRVVDVVLDCRERMWSWRMLAIGDGGEILREESRQGGITAEGLSHPGWCLAALDALEQLERMDLKAKPIMRIPEPGPTGFLVVTLPGRVRAEIWDESLWAVPWPPLYRAVTDLLAKLQPRILWDPECKN